MWVYLVIRRILIPLAICVAAGYLIYDYATAFRETPADRLAAMAVSELQKEKVFPFRRAVLQNPGLYYELPEDVRARIDRQIGQIAESGQQVLCCDYEDDELPRMCTGLVLWKDRMPMRLEDFVDVHPDSQLAYLGARAVSACPATRKEAWDIVGLLPGQGWSPKNIGKAGYPQALREKIIEGPD